MEKRRIVLIIIFGLMFIASGCVKAISKSLRAQVDTSLTLKKVKDNSEKYKGKIILWGGVIVNSKNLKEGTLLEIVQKPVDIANQPKTVDQSEGRFLALFDGYLDVAIYSSDREVTVSGPITETRTMPLGEIEYTYPVVDAKEIHLWPTRSKNINHIHPYWHYPSRYYYRYPWRRSW